MRVLRVLVVHGSAGCDVTQTSSSSSTYYWMLNQTKESRPPPSGWGGGIILDMEESNQQTNRPRGRGSFRSHSLSPVLWSGQ